MSDTARNVALVGILVAAPIALVIIVGMIRGYRFDLHMVRDRKRPPDDSDSETDGRK